MEKFLRGPALTETVRDHIKQYILEHHLKDGDPLPSENQFAQELGIGRSSVREAVKALQSLGIIEVRHGQGLYVRAYNMDSIFENFSFGMRFDHTTLMEWFQIRTWLETALVTEAINSLTPAALEAMEETLAEWARRLEADQQHMDLDERFHQLLYSGINNQILSKFLGVFWLVYRDLEVMANLTPTQAEKDATLAEHRQILAAIRRGDTLQAVRGLESGFNITRRRLSEHFSANGENI